MTEKWKAKNKRINKKILHKKKKGVAIVACRSAMAQSKK